VVLLVRLAVVQADQAEVRLLPPLLVLVALAHLVKVSLVVLAMVVVLAHGALAVVAVQVRQELMVLL
jgi:hypothetical protein